MMRVIVAVEDAVSGQELARLLRSHDVVVDQADHRAKALEIAKTRAYDVVLAALTLPDLDGCDLVRRLRAAGVDTPVLLLADQGRPQARILAFGAGADDVVMKPYDSAELLARLRAVVRRTRAPSQALLHCSPLQLNPSSREVSVAGQPVHLTGKEFAILELLVTRRGMVLTKEVFLNHLYGGMDEPEVKIIDVFLCKMRRKLALAGAPDLIGTVWGRGYIIRDADHRPMHPAVPPCPTPVLAVSA